MTDLVDTLRTVIVPFLIAGGLLLAGLLALLFIMHAVRDLQAHRRRRLTAWCRRRLELLDDSHAPAVLGQLARRTKDRLAIGEELVAAAKDASPERIARLRAAAGHLGLLDTWRQDLGDRRWWVRASAATAIGALRDSDGAEALLALMGDEDVDVRAVVIEALARLGDERAIPILFDQLADPSLRHRARIIGALGLFGRRVLPAALADLDRRPDNAMLIADLIVAIGGAVPEDEIVERCQHPSADVRAAALRMLAALRVRGHGVAAARAALGDPDAGVRAMAARALGRSGQPEAAVVLSLHLDDDWTVAAEAATALRRLGERGLDQLRTRAHEDGQAGDLARQMLAEVSVAEGRPQVA